MSSVRFDIIGKVGTISAPTFKYAISYALDILGELDSALSNRRTGSLNWYVGGLHADGRLSIELTPRIRPLPTHPRKPISQNIATEIARSFLASFEQVEKKPISPPFLSEFGLKRVGRLVDLIHKNGAKGFDVVSAEKTVHVSEKASANLKNILRVKRSAIGSVEGSLRAISIHRGLKVTVYHAITNKGVTCKSTDGGFLEEMKTSLGRRVQVMGLVHYNESNEPMKVDMDRLHVFGKEEDLPSFDKIGGSDPDFIGDQSTEEYIRSIRG